MAPSVYYLLTARQGVCISNWEVKRLIALVVLLVAVAVVHAHDTDCAVGASHALNGFNRCRQEASHSGHRLDLHLENNRRSRNSGLDARTFDVDHRDTPEAQGPSSTMSVDHHDLIMTRHSYIRGSQLLEQNSSSTQQEVRDLMSFRASVSADPLRTLSSWNANASTPCNWTGISCSSDGRHVIAVDLLGRQLLGNIGSALQALSRLQSLERVDLAGNSFTGSLPGTALGNWSGLSYLNISMNNITGELPSQVGELINLQTLDLQRNKLTGEIPPSICNCTALKSLDLGTNRLIGIIPEEIGRLSSLELLNLGTFVPDLQSYRPDANGNSFSGIIPPSLENCTLLKTLSLQNNPRLGDEIPLNLNRLTKLQVLNLSLCSFEGDIPEWIGNLTDLRIIGIRYNLFTGRIPTTLGNLRELNYLALANNNISGIIPPSILNCTSLSYLLLQMNAELTGDIPSDIGRLSKLRRFNLWETRVTGVLPASFSNCSGMEYIGVTDNLLMDPQPMPAWLGSLANLSLLFLNNIKMYGPIPKEVGRLANLQMLSIYTNFLTGSVPPELGNCTSLWLVQIGGNLLTGHLPPEIGNLPELEQFSVGYSYMSGALPASLSNMTKIELFDVSRGNFSGTIDSYWGNLPQLETLLFGLNQFVGSIPASLANSTTLGTVDLSANRLTGEIPPSLGNMTALSDLVLAENEIGGTIPPELVSATSLVTLDLGINRLEGNIPPNIGHLSVLQKLYLGGNKLSGNVPESLSDCSGLLVLDLSNNQFNGSIPADIISHLNSLTFLNISNNQFSGRWPPQLSSLAHIQEINASGNSLSGPFMPGVSGEANSDAGTLLSDDSGWMSLVKLDISRNDFSGVIPESLASLPLFSFFNASYNNFHGRIPSTGVFSNLTAASFLGNTLLCGDIPGLDRECQASSEGSSRPCKGFHCKRVWIPTICSAILLAGLLILAIWLFARAARRERSGEKKLQQNFILTFDPVIKFSADDVLRIIHQNQMIAKGPVSVVYKGMFPEDRILAVKVLSQKLYTVANGGQVDLTSRQSEVLHEVEIMANLRHRNILRVVGYCSHEETKALILEYMPEGSLWQHLHGLGDGKCRLSWQRRVNIALGVAEGMKYLHHDFPKPLIHGDLKPSNILLDATFLPKVADFGLSKFVSPHREGHATASSIHGTIGYIPPEYALGPFVSTKGDVYSYGIILLELLSGRSPTSKSSTNFDPSVDYRSWAVANYYQDPEGLIDSALREDSLADYKLSEQTRLMFLVALLCTREMPQSRPTMRDVLRMLMDINEITLDPVERKSLEELAHATPDRKYNYFNSWRVEDPNGTSSSSFSSGHSQ